MLVGGRWWDLSEIWVVGVGLVGGINSWSGGSGLGIMGTWKKGV